MRRRLGAIILATILLLGAPAAALASKDEVQVEHDARLDGYTQSVEIEGGSTASSWILFILLGLLVIGVMFKNPRRTHLD